MGDEVTGSRLKDFVELQRGKTYKSALLGQPGPVLLGLASIARNGGFKDDSLKTYGGTSDPRILLRPGDIYVSLKDVTQSADLLGSVARVPKYIREGRLTQDTVKLLFKSEDAPREYIYWLLRTPCYRAYCKAHATGTTNLGLSRDDFLSFPIPRLTAWRAALVALLEALDDKIGLNRRMNVTLESIARAIFRDWFVEFGPTRSKAEGQEPYLSAELWNLFPDSLDDEGKPTGWTTRPLDQIARFLNGLALQKYPPEQDEYLPVIKIAELRSGITEKSGRASPTIPAAYVVQDGDVLFSWSGSLTHLVWTGGKGALNQHLFKVTSDYFPKWFYFHWIGHHIPTFQAIAASKATTMGHIQRHHLSEAQTVVPSPEVMRAANDLIAPLFDRCISNSLENRTLTQIRDLLLPKLTSGQICLREAEKLVEAAA